jgi:hypothetical protein
LLLRMKYGDKCEYDNNKRYTVYILFEWDRLIDSNEIKYVLVFADVNMCEMYFVGKNKELCPVC